MLQEPTSDFPFENLKLGPPNGLQGGSYFTKLLLNDQNLYLQIPKCLTKQGVVVTEKKKYCDLMFSRDATDVIAWFENIERKAQQLMFEKKNTWFHDDLEFSDIENAFTSPIRSYKSGNYYLVRCTVPKVISPETISCYNENEEPVSLDELNESGVQLIPIIEIQGIKFSSKNFQIEIGLRQIMVIKKKELFNKCLIKVEKKKEESFFSDVKFPNGHNEEEPTEESIEKAVEEPNEEPKEQNVEVPNEEPNEQVVEVPNEEPNEQVVEQSVEEPNEQPNEEPNEQPIEQPNEQKVEQTNEEPNEQLNEIKLEVVEETGLNEINIDNINVNSEESLKLKNPNEVFYEMWKQARQKAKEAKREALEAYLQAKQIKEQYNLDVLDSESESEIESDDLIEDEHEVGVLA
jgi:hypothetical protein